MSDMDMSGMMGGSMSGMMNMSFYNSQNTALYSMGWVPASMGQYAGTCIFLIVLGAFYRCLIAGKAILKHKWTNAERDRRLIVVKDKVASAEQQEPSKTGTFISSKGEREDVRVLKGLRPKAAPWRISVDLPRAAFTMLIAGIGYLLMLAIMTMNAGYFMSVLAGIFVGELGVGRYGAAVSH